jgi:hypothetical protein
MSRTQIKTYPARGERVYRAWGEVQRSGPIGLRGTDLLDGGVVAALKSEWLAASAGVVPFLPLPGGGQGVLTIGGALRTPDSAWSDPVVRGLYRSAHQNLRRLHGQAIKRRIGTPRLVLPGAGQQALSPQQRAALQSEELAVPPAVWVVVSVVGVLATVAGAWYAVRTKETEIQTEAELLQRQATIGRLSDLASAQLQSTGEIQPDLVEAIRATGAEDVGQEEVWPWVMGGVGLAAAGGLAWYAWGRR